MKDSTLFHWRYDVEELVEKVLPNWSSTCKCVLLVQPSSAAAERVSSILSNSFTDRQEHSLKDYIETSVMLQYNCR